jgi:hypothetical protein
MTYMTITRVLPKELDHPKYSKSSFISEVVVIGDPSADPRNVFKDHLETAWLTFRSEKRNYTVDSRVCAENWIRTITRLCESVSSSHIGGLFVHNTGLLLTPKAPKEEGDSAGAGSSAARSINTWTNPPDAPVWLNEASVLETIRRYGEYDYEQVWDTEE